MRHLNGVSFVSFPVQNQKNETRALTGMRHLEVSKTPEIPLKILVPDRGCEQTKIAKKVYLVGSLLSFWGGFLVE
jgi:hypothetical protein